MKKIILIGIVMLISVTIFAQKRSTVLSVPDTTTAFNMSLSAGDWVFARDSNIIYSLTAQAYATTTIQTATKIRLTGVSMGYWDKDQDTLKTDSAYAISLDNSLFVHKGFIAAGESELRDTTKQTNALLFMNGSNFAGFKFGGATKNLYILPTDDGTAGQFLSTNASAVLSWASEIDPIYANDSIKIVWFRDSTGIFITPYDTILMHNYNEATFIGFADSTGYFITPYDTTLSHTWVETNFMEFSDSTGNFITPYDTTLSHTWVDDNFIEFSDSTGYFITPYDTTLSHTWVETNFLEFGDSTGYFITPYDTTLTHTWITTNFAGLSSDNIFTGTNTLSDTLYQNNANGDTSYWYNHTDTTHLYSENPFSIENDAYFNTDIRIRDTVKIGTDSIRIYDGGGDFWLERNLSTNSTWSSLNLGDGYAILSTFTKGITINDATSIDMVGDVNMNSDLSVTGISNLHTTTDATVDSVYVKGNSGEVATAPTISTANLTGNIGNSTTPVDTVFATSIKVTLLTGALTDGVPTDAEIDAIIGLTPLQFTGSQVTIKDSDGTGLMYKIESDGTNWFYLVMTKAL